MQEYVNKEELVKIVKEHVASIIGSGTLRCIRYIFSKQQCLF